MTYKLIYTQRAVKDIQKLDKQIKTRIGEALQRFKENPFHNAVKLADVSLGTYRYRMGEYRIVFDIVDDEIVILRVGHRKDIYKRR
jgi:mRNA interferase RelE/StbE